MAADAPRVFTIDEVIALGFEAYHVDEDGAWWLFHGNVGLRSNSVTGVRSLITDPALLPKGPWHPTVWGEQDLRRAGVL